jgi:hypothetical protein
MNQLKFSLKFRSQIENQVSDYRLVRASSFFNIQNLNISLCYSKRQKNEFKIPSIYSLGSFSWAVVVGNLSIHLILPNMDKYFIIFKIIWSSA